MDFRIVREEKQVVDEAIDLSQRLLRANLVMGSCLPAEKKKAYEEICPSRCHRTRLVMSSLIIPSPMLVRHRLL